MSKIRAELNEKGGVTAVYHLLHDRVFYKGKMVIPKKSYIINSLLLSITCPPWEGTMVNIRHIYVWSKIGIEKACEKTVIEFVRQCAICPQQKASHQQPADLLHPLPIPEQVTTLL